MTEKLENTTLEAPGVLGDKNNIMGLDRIFNNTIKEYSKNQKLNPNKAKEITIRQLQEFENLFVKYKEEGGESDSREAITLRGLENYLQIAKTLLLEGIGRETILEIIHNNRGNGFNSLLVFLPDEYTNNGTVKEEILKESGIAFTHAGMKTFLSGQREDMPYFDNNDFKKHPEIIKEALSKKIGTILESYELWGIYEGYDELMGNPVFIKMLNEILALQYPDIFGKAQDSKWYNEGKMSFDKTTTLLDIIKYRPEARQKDFIDMMNTADNGDTDEAIQLYEEYFIGTGIGNKITGYFDASSLANCLRNDVQKTWEENIGRQENKKGGILNLVDKHEFGKLLVSRSFEIPSGYLRLLLLCLPTIEAHCSNGNTKAVIKIIDSLGIDDLYKQRFITIIKGITSLGCIEINDPALVFYTQIERHYLNHEDVSAEKKILEGQGKEGDAGKAEYTIVTSAFPHMSNKERQKKNDAFENFLNDKNAIKEGKINVTRAELIDCLRPIFEGSNILEKINVSKDGKDIFQLLSQAYSEQKDKQVEKLKNDGFTIEKWMDFQKEDGKKSKIILEKLKNTSDVEEKIKILADFIDSEKIPGKDQMQERKNFMDSIVQQIGMLESTTKNARAFMMNEENLKDFSTSWKTGNFSEFNEKTQARELKREEDEIKKQEQKGPREQNGKIHSAAFIDFQSLGSGFSKIETGKIITTNINGKETYIKKNSENVISIYSEGIPIENINISDPKNAIKDIKKAMNSIQFLQKYGLGVFRDDIPTIVELINNRALRKGGTKINLSDDIGPDEELALLESIAKLANLEIMEGSPTDKLAALKNNFHGMAQNGRLTSILRVKGFIEAGSHFINKGALNKGIKNMA